MTSFSEKRLTPARCKALSWTGLEQQWLRAGKTELDGQIESEEFNNH